MMLLGWMGNPPPVPTEHLCFEQHNVQLETVNTIVYSSLMVDKSNQRM